MPLSDADAKARIVTVLRAGNWTGTAIATAGVPRATFERWVAEDAAFADQVSRAVGLAEARMVEALRMLRG